MMETDYHKIPSGHPFPKHPGKTILMRHVDGKPQLRLNLKASTIQQSVSDHAAALLVEEHGIDLPTMVADNASSTYWHEVLKPAVMDAVAMMLHPVPNHAQMQDHVFHILDKVLTFHVFVRENANMFALPSGMTTMNVMVVPWPRAHELAFHEGIPDLLVFQSSKGSEYVGSWFCGYKKTDQFGGGISEYNMHPVKQIGPLLTTYKKDGLIPGEMIDLGAAPPATGKSQFGALITAKHMGKTYVIDALTPDDIGPVPDIGEFQQKVLNAIGQTIPPEYMGYPTTGPEDAVPVDAPSDDLCTGPMEMVPKHVEDVGPEVDVPKKWSAGPEPPKKPMTMKIKPKVKKPKKKDPLIQALDFAKKYGTTSKTVHDIVSKPSPPVTLEQAQAKLKLWLEATKFEPKDDPIHGKSSAMAQNFIAAYGGKAFDEVMGGVHSDQAGHVAQLMENAHLANEFQSDFGCPMPSGVIQLYKKLKETEHALVEYKMMHHPGSMVAHENAYKAQSLVHELQGKIAEAVGQPLMTAKQANKNGDVFATAGGHKLKGFKAHEFQFPPYIPLHTTDAILTKKVDTPEVKAKKTLNRYGVIEVK